MSAPWDSIVGGIEDFILFYFAILALIYATSAFIGMRSITVYARELSPIALKELLERGFYKPVSILVPAYNEEDSIVSNLQSFLSLHYPEFEAIVAVDGATDATLARITEAFDLQEQPWLYRKSVETAPVHRVFRSALDPHLLVIEKDNGGRADAINAALNLARYPLVCVVDSDSLLNPEALARASRLFIEDDAVVGVGGSLRPLNGAVVEDGQVVEVHAPKRWVERVQVLEYARAFFITRAAWSRLGSLLIISGAFGLFRRTAVIEVGGWVRGFVADDLEMVIKLHRHFRERGQHYQIRFTPDPVCWTAVPDRVRDLRLQRCMWERGILEVLGHHKGMLFNPRYGRIGMVAIPYMWIFESGATLVETLGYLLVIVTAALGVLDVTFAVLFLLLAVLFGVLFSELGLGVQTMLLIRHERARDRLVLFLAAFAEYLGMRQLIVVSRTLSFFQVRSRRGQYWRKESTQGSGSDKGDKVDPDGEGEVHGALR